MCKNITIIFLILTASLGLLSGCSSVVSRTPINSTNNNPNSNAENTGGTDSLIPTTPEGFGLKGVRWSQYSIIIDGFAGLPAGILLESKLYEDSQPVIWWPINQNVQVQDGLWEIVVTAGENGAPNPLPEIEEGYSLKIWEKSNPTIFAVLSLFYPHPPTQ
jgi:hypothetical protein